VRFVAALGFSLLLHAVAAFVASRHPPVHRAATRPKPLQTATRVVLFTRAADPPPAVAAAARVEAPPRPARATVRAAAATPAPGPAAEAPPEAAAGETAAPEPEEAGTVQVVATGYPGGGMDALEVAGGGPGQAAFDPAALHSKLAASAQRCYPAAARRFSLTGEAQLEFCLDENGALGSHTLTHSSGQSLLDSAALDCVLQGAQPFPAEAFGGCYSVPVRFGR
jgi:TonB family protein